MGDVNIADIFFITLVCIVIYAILSLVRRSNKKAEKPTEKSFSNHTEENRSE